jgi:hypothetical protein
LAAALLSRLDSLDDCLDLGTATVEIEDLLVEDLIHDIELELLGGLDEPCSMIQRYLFWLLIVPNFEYLIV